MSNYHFEREEELQEIAGFPQCSEHKKIHRDMLNELMIRIKSILFDTSNQNFEEDRASRKISVEKFLRAA